jgi:Uma2 family endonuclease
MTWQEIINHKDLTDLPFKIETNEYGQVVMSPTKYLHGIYQTRMAEVIKQFLPDGFVSTETAVATRKGVKVPDVAWASLDFFLQHRDELELSACPELCALVLSPNNSAKEISQKRKLYFERGALEVWTCDLNGAVHFYNPDGELEQSGLVQGFPNVVELVFPKA